MSKALTAKATMTSRIGRVVLTLDSGETYNTADSGNFVDRLDKLIGADGWKRDGYTYRDGHMTANLTRSQLLADHVAKR